MSIGEMTYRGALFGSALFFNAARNSVDYEDLSGERVVSQLVLYTGTGAACGALVCLGLSVGQKMCPRALSVATTIARSLSSGCFWVAKSTGRCLLKLGGGYVGGIVAGMAGGITIFAAKEAHIIAEDVFNDAMANVSACPQYFRDIRTSSFAITSPELPLETRDTVADGVLFVQGALIPALVEETFLREIVQDILLKRMPSCVLKRVMPGKEKLLQTKTYTVARIVLSSALFSALHLLNNGSLPDSYVQAQLVGTFAQGMVFGVIKETGLGLGSSIIAHAINNGRSFRPCYGWTEK